MNNSDHSVRDEQELTAAQRGVIASRALRSFKAELSRAAAAAAKRRAQRMVKELEEEIERGGDIFEVKARTVPEMHAFGYEIINRELSRLDAKSRTCGLDEDEIQSLMRLMGTLNTTEKTKASTGKGQEDETKQREGESDDDYRARLESALKR